VKILLTGADGFLGWHTRVRLRALTDHDVIPVERSGWRDLGRLAKGADAIIHCAGVNRGAPVEVEQGNVDLATAVADAAVQGGSCPRIVYANSIQASTDSPYGRGKRAAGEQLAAAAAECGGMYTDVLLPNLFGEHGRRHYNSFVATFVDAVINNVEPDVQDRQVVLLHAQSAAQALIDGLTTTTGRIDPAGRAVTVQGVLRTLQDLRTAYRRGDIPSLTSDFQIDLFNTLRAAMFPTGTPIMLTAHSDSRGRLVETVRCGGGQGQTFISTTRPGITRGEHFHLRKVERFVVVSGRARISLRKLFSSEVISFEVSGEEPVAVDMPTMWVHSISNLGEGDLTTMFWTNSLFDPKSPDTYPQSVAIGG